MAGDDSLHLGLVDAVDHGIVSQVGVESDQGEGLFEAGLGGQHPLSSGVSEDAERLVGLLA